MNEPVDVVIVGAGAAGAALAWSLADTRMRILCLDQGHHAIGRQAMVGRGVVTAPPVPADLPCGIETEQALALGADPQPTLRCRREPADPGLVQR